MPTAPIAIIAVVVLASILSGHAGLIALVPVLVFLIVRRLAGGRAPAPRRPAKGRSITPRPGQSRSL